jgi:Uma2 family endonuclease
MVENIFLNGFILPENVFYEQILKVTVYVIFDPEDGILEFFQLENEPYQLKQPDENGYHWLYSMG